MNDTSPDLAATGRREPADLAEALHNTAETARLSFRADACLIFPLSPITGRFLEMPVVSGDLPADARAVLTQTGEGSIAWQLIRQPSILVEDLAEERSQGPQLPPVALRALAGASLRIPGTEKHLAVLYLGFRQPHRFPAEERQLLDALTGSASMVLHNVWLRHRYSQVTSLGQEINQELGTPAVLFDQLRLQIGEILDSQHFFLLAVYRAPTTSLDLYIVEDGQVRWEFDRPLEGGARWVINEQQPLLVEWLSRQAGQLPAQLRPLSADPPEQSLIFVPLAARGVSFGMLSVQHLKPYAYTAEDMHLLQLLGNHVTVAISNMRLFDNLSQLAQVGQSFTRQLDSARLLEEVVDKIRTTTGAHSVILYPYDQVHKRFEEQPQISGTLPDVIRPAMPPYSDLAQRVLDQSEALFARNSWALVGGPEATPPPNEQRGDRRDGLLSTAIIPLGSGDAPLGVLFVNFQQPQHFDAPQKEVIQGLAAYAAIAINNSRRFDEHTKLRLRELEVLQEIDRAIAQSTELTELLRTILDLGQRHIGARDAAIELYNPVTNTLETYAAIGHNAAHREKQFVSMSSGDRGIIRWVYENQRPALVRDLKFEEFWRDMYYLVEDDIRSELDVPLLDDGKVLGVLNFESDQPSAFNAVDQQFLEVLAGQAVLAIKNATALMKYSQGYELLREVGQKLGAIAELTSLDGALDQAYAVVVAVADDQFKCQVVIRRYDPQTRELVLKRVARTMEPPPFPRMALSEGVNGQLAQACQENPADESCDTCMVYDVLRPPPGLELKLSDPATHSLVVTPIVFQGQYYGNLGLSHPEPNYFKYTHLPLIEALAQELATTIHRLETLHAKQEAERRAHELEAMSWIGRQAFAFAHRLSGDLGLIRTQIERIRDDLREHGIENRRVNKRLDGMTNRIQPLLDEIGGLKKQLTEYVSTGRSLPKPKREDVVIKGLLKDVVERLAAKLPDRIQIDTQITDDVAAARVVSAQVADILHNLIENSIQAITGDGTITLRAYNDGRYVALQVADTGIGIPEDKAGQLFNLAFGTRGSSGFGLWSSLLTAFENGGDLRLTNTQVGVGTTFTLRLPRADLDAATAGLVASPDEPVGSAV